MRIVVVVEGGLVQEVLTNIPGAIRLDVIDLDLEGREERAERAENRERALRETLRRIVGNQHCPMTADCPCQIHQARAALAASEP